MLRLQEVAIAARTSRILRIAEKPWSKCNLILTKGADIVMVKPAVTYLDVISDIAQAVDIPVAAYHVSGEYAMVKAASERGWIDGTAVAIEQITAVKRAGADIILTYFASELAAVVDE